MKYSFTLEAGISETHREKIVLESRSSESSRHILQKIMAYLLFRDRCGGLPLRIEPGEIGQRHRPDLMASDPLTERPIIWIECGQIEPKRLGRIASTNRDARIVVVKQTRKEAELYAQVAAKELPVLGQGAARFVGYFGFSDGFMADLIANLRGVNTVYWQPVSDDGNRSEVSLIWNGLSLTSALFPISAQASPLTVPDFWANVTIDSIEKTK